ncbi:MAG TPA: NCS2 family permease [Bacteroidetes bacterium]|nr:NCS2 family permease [Bacteroidota bacterium]
MKAYFRFEEFNTGYRQEIIAGITTFITMSYIMVLNPAILSVAGIPKGPTLVATILSAIFGTLVMGVYAKRPFAIAPYMGENAFIAYTVVKVLGYSWQTALGAIFIGGVLFVLLTVFKIRSWLIEAIPENLKYAFAAGIGLFLIFIGLNETGLVVAGTPLKLGDIRSLSILLSVAGFFIIAILMIYKIKGAILWGIMLTALLCFLFGTAPAPEKIVSMPPGITPIFLKLDIAGALTWGFFSVILTVFVMDFVDTMGTLIGVSARAGLLDENGNLPEIEKPLLADSLATVAGALLGTTTTGTYIESAAGIEAGGRTGFTSVVVAVLFAFSLFFTPVFTAIPAAAYGPALILVGIFIMEPIRRIDFQDLTELIPALIVVVLMSFTYNIGVGMTAGFVLYPVFKLFNGQAGIIKPGLWVLFLLSLLFFIFYPY